jgi:hypothetical protein
MPVKPSPVGGTAAPGPAKWTQRRKLVLAGALAAVVLALALILPLAFRGDDKDPSAGRKAGGPVATAGSSAAQAPVGSGPAATSAAPSATASPAATATAAPTPTTAPSTPPPATEAFALPSGWRMHRDPTGFSVPVPGNWSVSHQGTEVYFRERGTGRLMIVDQTSRPKSDPVQDWRNQERQRRGGYSNYNLIGIRAVDYYQKAADWEFTYSTNSGFRQHVVKRGFVVSKNKAYGIHWSTSASDWEANRDDMNLIFKGFKPAGG